MVQVLIAIPFIILGVLLLVALLAAMAFFVGIIGVGWLRTIAPPDELAALPPLRRRIVTVRALLVVAAFWIILLAVNSSSSSTRYRHNDTGDEAFAYWYGTLRRLSGLPPRSGPV